MSLSGKKIAFFGTGDQKSIADTFIDAIGIIKSKLAGTGAQFIGNWPTDDYEYEASIAVEDDFFIGLALDDDNQAEESDDRIAKWVGQLKGEIG